MTTEQRTAINRENAQHSTGPRTPEGKIISSQNRRNHGFRSSTVLAPGDDPAAYNEVLDDLRAAYGPTDMAEDRIVRELANAEYRLRCVRDHLQSALARHAQTIAQRHPELNGADLQSRVIETLAETGCSFATWLRYESNYERQYDRAQTEFWRYRKLCTQQQAAARKSRLEAIKREMKSVEYADDPGAGLDVNDELASYVFGRPMPPGALASNAQKPAPPPSAGEIATRKAA